MLQLMVLMLVLAAGSADAAIWVGRAPVPPPGPPLHQRPRVRQRHRRPLEARRILAVIVEEQAASQRAGFGYIASEADLARLKK